MRLHINGIQSVAGSNFCLSPPNSLHCSRNSHSSQDTLSSSKLTLPPDTVAGIDIRDPKPCHCSKKYLRLKYVGWGTCVCVCVGGGGA